MMRWRTWVDLFGRRERGTALALLRIAIGLVALATLASTGAAGLVDVLWIDREHGGFGDIGGNWLVQALGGPTPDVMWPVFWTTIAAAVLVVVGLGARAAALVALLGYTALVTAQPDTSGGGDLLVINGLWLLVLADCEATLSLRCLLTRRRLTCDRLVPAWPRYLFIFQIVIVYFAAGMQKMAVHWTPAGGYLALHYVLQDPTWIRFSGDAFTGLSPLTRVATAVTWHWEQLAPVLLLYYYYRDTADRGGRLRRWLTRFDLRTAWAAVGAGLHLGIFLVLDVGMFSLASLAYYLALWHPDELARAAARLRRRPG